MAVGLLAALASLRPAAAAVGSSDDGASAFQAASYSTGRSGSQLKWLPQRPESARSDRLPTCPTASARRPLPRPGTRRLPTSTSPACRAIGAEEATPKPAPPEKLGDDLLQLPAEPKPQGPLPGPKPEEPAAAEKPYAPPGGLTPLNQPKPAKNGSNLPPLEQEFAPQQHEFKEGCPSVKDLKHIADLTTNITPSEGDLPHDCPLGGAAFQPRAFAPITYAWTASGLCHKPLYFEDVQLERYGHMLGPWSQPIASAANFFVSIPALPYKMGLEPPTECIYTLGYYRPGDCAPYMIDPLPLSVRGALFEAGAWVGGVAIFP